MKLEAVASSPHFCSMLQLKDTDWLSLLNLAVPFGVRSVLKGAVLVSDAGSFTMLSGVILGIES